MNNLNVNKFVDARGRGEVVNNKGPGCRLRSGERMCYQGSALQEAKHLSSAKFTKGYELIPRISYSGKKNPSLSLLKTIMIYSNANFSFSEEKIVEINQNLNIKTGRER